MITDMTRIMTYSFMQYKYKITRHGNDRLAQITTLMWDLRTQSINRPLLSH